MRNITPPTTEEIKIYRQTIMEADTILKHEPRDYSDESVAAALVEPMPDSGGTALGELRAFGPIAEATRSI